MDMLGFWINSPITVKINISYLIFILGLGCVNVAPTHLQIKRLEVAFFFYFK